MVVQQQHPQQRCRRSARYRGCRAQPRPRDHALPSADPQPREQDSAPARRTHRLPDRDYPTQTLWWQQPGMLHRREQIPNHHFQSGHQPMQQSYRYQACSLHMCIGQYWDRYSKVAWHLLGPPLTSSQQSHTKRESFQPVPACLTCARRLDASLFANEPASILTIVKIERKHFHSSRIFRTLNNRLTRGID